MARIKSRLNKLEDQIFKEIKERERHNYRVIYWIKEIQELEDQLVLLQVEKETDQGIKELSLSEYLRDLREVQEEKIRYTVRIKEDITEEKILENENIKEMVLLSYKHKGKLGIKLEEEI